MRKTHIQPHTLVVALFALYNWSPSTQARVADVDIVALEDKITTLVDAGLGIRHMQNYLNDFVYFSREVLDLLEKIDKLEKRLTDVIESRFATLVQDSKRYSDTYTSENNFIKPPLKRCCKLTDLTYSDHFKNNIDKTQVCYEISSDTPQYEDFVGELVIQAFQNNLIKNPELKFQYLGTESGLSFVYPSVKTGDCGTYDPRFKPWYLQAANPKPKEVVFVLDNSLKMATTYIGKMSLWQHSIDIVHNLIDSLLPYDRTALVTFSSFANPLSEIPGTNDTNECLEESLAPVTINTRRLLRGYLEKAPVGDHANSYGIGLERAFMLLESSPDFNDTSKDRAIILVSGVATTDAIQNIENVMRKFNKKFSDTVRFGTFCVGLQEKSPIHSTMYEIVNFFGEGSGFYQVVDVSDGGRRRLGLRAQLSPFVDFFKVLTLKQPIVTYPYYEESTGGLVNTATMPIFSNGKLVAVVAVDMSSNDWVDDYQAPGVGENNYGFVIEKDTGYVMYHPLVPVPQMPSPTPVLVKITEMEKDEGLIEGVLNPMRKSESGFYNITTRRLRANGFSFAEGIFAYFLHAYYYYSDIKMSRYSMCLVYDFSLITKDIIPKIPLKAKEVKFDYHVAGLNGYVEEPDYCRTYFRKSFPEGTYVKFAPEAFYNPASYIVGTETAADVKLYKNTILGINKISVFKSGVIGDVLITNILDELWRPKGELSSLEMTPSIWRYIGTQRGVIRMFPGVQLPKDYDPRRRRWYYKALSKPSEIVASPPYLDTYGAGYVVTLSQALLEPGGTVFGVMGVDIKIQYLWDMLYDQKGCFDFGYKCFMMDRSGFILVHESWIVGKWTTPPPVQNVHITLKEPFIAQHMIKKGYLAPKTCAELFEGRENKFFEANFSSVDHMLDRDAYYKAKWVAASNVYVVQKAIFRQPNLESTCICDRAPDIKYPGMCNLELQTACECPCSNFEDRGNVDICSGKILYEDWIPCVPKRPNIYRQLESATLEQGYFTGYCLNSKCEEQTNMHDCHTYHNCRWCDHTTKGKPLPEPFCGGHDTCWFGQLSSRWLYFAPDEGWTKTQILLLILFILTTIALIVSYVVWRYHVFLDIVEFCYDTGVFIATPRATLKKKWVFIPKNIRQKVVRKKKLRKKKLKTTTHKRTIQRVTVKKIIRRKKLKKIINEQGEEVEVEDAGGEYEFVEVEEEVDIEVPGTEDGTEEGSVDGDDKSSTATGGSTMTGTTDDDDDANKKSWFKNPFLANKVGDAEDGAGLGGKKSKLSKKDKKGGLGGIMALNKAKNKFGKKKKKKKDDKEKSEPKKVIPAHDDDDDMEEVEVEEIVEVDADEEDLETFLANLQFREPYVEKDESSIWLDLRGSLKTPTSSSSDDSDSSSD